MGGVCTRQCHFQERKSTCAAVTLKDQYDTAKVPSLFEEIRVLRDPCHYLCREFADAAIAGRPEHLVDDDQGSAAIERIDLDSEACEKTRRALLRKYLEAIAALPLCLRDHHTHRE